MHWIERLTGHRLRVPLALVCAVALAPGDTFAVVISRPQDATTSAPSEDVSRIPPEQLDSLVAPIALYPDPLLAQVLAASTYPLELMQLQQWLQKNSGLKDKALVDAVSKQPWDPSIQAMAALPDVVKRLAQLGQTRAFGTPEQFAALMKSEYERWGRVVKASGAKAD